VGWGPPPLRVCIPHLGGLLETPEQRGEHEQRKQSVFPETAGREEVRGGSEEVLLKGTTAQCYCNNIKDTSE
ncbi:hypothetical protein GN956_G26422, partial [Arapaima gigas]